MPRLALRMFSTIDAIAALPSLAVAGHERHSQTSYHRATEERLGHYVAVQIGLSGHGALWERPGPWRGEPGWRDVPPGHALIFVIGEDKLSYGFPPTAAEPWEFVFANIEGEAALVMARGLIAQRGRVMALDPRHEVVGELKRLAHASGRGGMTAETGCRIVGSLFAALVAGPQDDGHDLVRQAMVQLDVASGPVPGVATVARRLGVSREHLTRLFSRYTGRPPAHWLADQRLARARQMLEDPALSMASIAAAAGFGSATQLIRRFVAHHGLTPGLYRRRLANAGHS